MLSRLRMLLRATVSPDEVDAEIEEELRLHLEMRAEELEAGGLSPDSAEREARRRFGDLRSVRRECRRLAMLSPTHQGDPAMTSLLRDLRFALRALVRTPGFTLVVLATLALGIGANTAIFSIVEGVLLRPLPYEDADRLVMLWENDRLRGTTREGFSGPDYFDILQRSDVFEGLAAFQILSFTVTDDSGEPSRVRTAPVTPGLASVLGVAPILGRDLSSEDDAVGAPPVVLLSHSLWVDRFGADRSALGDVLVLEGVSREIVGVLPPRLGFPTPDVGFWIPLQLTPTSMPRGNHGLSVVGRMAPGISLEKANANLQAIAGALEVEYVDDNQGRGMWSQSLYDASVGSVKRPLWLLLGAVAVVLLIACVNVANLLFARALSRQQETALRSAMGASRAALARQYLTESMLLSLLGGLIGFGVARGGLQFLLAIVPTTLPRASNIGLNPYVLGFALLVSIAVGVVFGLAPLLQTTERGLAPSLREGSRSGAGAEKQRLRTILATAEIALAVTLVIGAGLLIHSFVRLIREDPGLAHTNVIAVNLQLPASRYPQPRAEFPAWTSVRNFQEELLSRLEALPGVESAAIAINSPLSPGWTSRFTIEGRPEVAPGQQDEVRVRVVSPGYLRALGIPLLRGRALEPSDERDDAPAVIMINEAFAKRYFPDEDPLGARLSQWDLTREIVGIVKDVKFLGLAQEAAPAIYPTFSQSPFPGFTALVRTRESPEESYARMRDTIWSLDRDLAPSNLTTIEEMLASSVAQPRFTMLLFVFFGLVALSLAAVGIYGVMSYTVSQRIREIGVRMSLGAERGDILRLVLGQGARITAAGIIAGLMAAALLARFLETLLYGVTGLDPVTFAGVSLLATLIALAACYLPAMRAARVDPIVTLRHE